ncbi:MAG: lycopene cyclase domain-containing protein [Actinomycetes bacterium]|jgi:lycopene cyclase domain-containing protein
MSYTAIAVISLLISGTLDLYIIKSKLLTRKIFWTSYAIILPFQLLTNWWLTSREIVIYNDSKIIGIRIASAPVEDLFFGFSLVLSVLALWIYFGRREANDVH